MGRRRYLVPLLFLLALTAADSHAQSSHLSIQILDGRVFLLAHNVSLRAILEEWERTSGVRFVNADQLDDATPLTLQLSDVTEQAGLATLLRGIPGYVVVRQPGTSSIDRILLLAKTTASPAAVSRVPASLSANTSVEASGDFAGGTPGRGLANPAYSEESELQGPPAPELGAQSTVAAVRINSSDSIVGLVDGANPATVVPPELRPETPLLRPPAAVATRPGEITGGAPPPGFVDPVVTNPKAHEQETRVPTAGTSR